VSAALAWPTLTLPPCPAPLPVGDCRAVLARGAEAVQITADHKPGDAAEAARIARDHAVGRALAAAAAAADAAPRGGRDQAPRAGGGSPPAGSAAAALAEPGDVPCGSPLVSADGYLYGELGVARALGSQHLKRDPNKAGFTHTPDVFSVALGRRDDLLLLASDGLWDGIDNSEAVTAARRVMAREKDAAACARALADRAVRRGSTDNISVVVVALHDRGIALPKTNSMLFRRLPSGSSCGGLRRESSAGACGGGDGECAAPGAACGAGAADAAAGAGADDKAATPAGSTCATPAGGASRSGTPPPPPPTPPPHAGG
jgi:hypothetical protein